jgi:predicted metal-binding membrane protein
MNPGLVVTSTRWQRSRGRRITFADLSLPAAIGVVAWWATVDDAHRMSGMVDGLAQVGRAMPFTTGLLSFLGMWFTMMLAMMLPAVAPTLVRHRSDARQSGQRAVSTWVFGSAYFAIWALSGTVALAGLVALRTLNDAPGSARVGGAVLFVAALYQLGPWKRACLVACRLPAILRAARGNPSGLTGAARAGASHGLTCLGCCWALMAELFAVGLMNVAWMVTLAAIFVVERTWRHGLGFSHVVGVIGVGLGVGVLAHPSLLNAVALLHP